MSLQVPIVSGSTPAANATDVVLRPTIEVVFGGQSLIDPLTWDASTFAVYGPGDVVLEAGPGTILNSGLSDSPFPLLDGPLFRERCVGTYRIVVSGTNNMDTAESVIGTASQLTLGRFTPSYPLLTNTEYTAVLIGNDSGSMFIEDDRAFPGITSYTSPSGFVQSGVINYSGVVPSLTGATSGFIQVIHPYSKTLQTGSYNSTTGRNDIYTIEITSGNSTAVSGFKYQWYQDSTPGVHQVVVSGATTHNHNLGNGLKINFVQPFSSGEVHNLNVYLPLPVANSYSWKFSTGEIESFSSPPVEPGNISVVIDETDGGGFGVDTVEQLSGSQFYVISSDPTHLEYDVLTGLSYIQLEFNKPITSGSYAVGNVEVTSTPLLGIPAPAAASAVTPTRLETSGAFLKIFLP